MNKKLWAGRFKEKTDKELEEFTESVSFDARLAIYDIQGSIAHAKMLAKCGIISEGEAERIIKGLEEIGEEIRAGKFKFRKELEDVHMNIEQALIERIGDTGKKLHTARSRNDQVALDERLYLRDEITQINLALDALIEAFTDLSKRYKDIVMPGFTHLQHAQPVLFKWWCEAYIAMLARDKERFLDVRKRVNRLPLGACALAGTTLPIDREYVAKLLEFDAVLENTLDAVSDRDYIVETLACVAIGMMHLSRLCEELVLFSSWEFSFIELPDSLTTGSSIMPQKKNPDAAELVRGKTGRVYGALVSILTVMKGLPLTYNRDMQEDKEALFDALDTYKASLNICTKMIKELRLNERRVEEAAEAGFIQATYLAEYLVGKDVPFREAHKVVGEVVRYCVENSLSLKDLPLKEYKSFNNAFEEDLYEWLDVKKMLKRMAGEEKRA